MQKKTLIIGTAALVLAFSAGVGAGGSKAPAAAADPKPVPTATVTAAPVEKRVEVKTTPPECLTALDLNEQGFTYAAEAMSYMNEAVQAAGRMNVTGLNAANEKLKIVNPKLTALGPQMNAAKAACRAAK